MEFSQRMKKRCIKLYSGNVVIPGHDQDRLRDLIDEMPGLDKFLHSRALGQITAQDHKIRPRLARSVISASEMLVSWLPK